MKYFNFLIIILFVTASELSYSQRGPEKSAYLSFSRNNDPQSNKYGFDFTGLKFGYQFANCGGNVIVGINYSKNVTFTTYWLNGKSYGKDIIGEDLWPKPSDVEVNTVKADLYYGSQNLGKITFNYIVGNFTGCFGETYDVLSQVGLSSSDKKYKDNLNMLSLVNIQIVNARAIGMWRDGKISERLQQLKKQKETEKINEQVNALLQSVDYRILARNYEAAKELLEKAYKLKPSQEIKNKINETNELIRKKAIDDNVKNKTNEAYTLVNSGNYDAALAKFKEVYATNPSDQIKEQIDYISKKIEEKKKEDNSVKSYTKKEVEPKKSTYKINTNPKTKKSSSSYKSYTTSTYTYNPNLSPEANHAINMAINKQNELEQRKLNEQRRIYNQKLKEEQIYQKKLAERRRRERLIYIEEKRKKEKLEEERRIAEERNKSIDESIKNNKKDKENFNSYFNSGLAAYNKSNFKDAIFYYEKAMDINPQNVNLHFNLGISYFQIKDYSNAEKCFSNTLLMNPTFPGANLNYGILILLQEEPLIKEMETLGYSDSDEKRYNVLAIKQKNLLKKALLYLEREYKLDQNNPKLNDILISVYKDLGMNKEANSILKK